MRLHRHPQTHQPLYYIGVLGLAFPKSDSDHLLKLQSEAFNHRGSMGFSIGLGPLFWPFLTLFFLIVKGILYDFQSDWGSFWTPIRPFWPFFGLFWPYFFSYKGDSLRFSIGLTPILTSIDPNWPQFDLNWPNSIPIDPIQSPIEVFLSIFWPFSQYGAV